MKFWGKFYYYGGMVGIVLFFVAVAESIITNQSPPILRALVILAISIFSLLRGYRAKKQAAAEQSQRPPGEMLK